MRKKKFTRMMSSVTWFDSHIGFSLKPIKNLLQNGWTDKEEIHTNVPQAIGVQVCSGIIDRSHDLAAILD